VTEGPTYRYPDGRSVQLSVSWATTEASLLALFTDIVDEATDPKFATSAINLPFSLLREVFASHGWALVEIPKDREKPETTEAVLTRFVAHLLRDLKKSREKREEAEELVKKEHKRADENFLDLRNEIGRNRADVRETIVDYLNHISQLEVSTVFSESTRQFVGVVAQWLQGELDVVWASEQEGRGAKAQ
jgi:hypothetical protein